MKVFLGNSPWIKKGYYGVRAGSRWPHFEKENHQYMPFPFFLAYAAALLEKHNIKTLLVDGIAERISDSEFFRRINVFGPDLIVLEVSTVSLDKDLETARYLKESIDRDIKIVFCGLHYGMYKADFLKEHEFVDFVLKGEYEYTLLELVQSLDKNLPLDNILGIVYRGNKSIIKDNPFRSSLKDLDKLPWPARHFLPKDGYEDLPEILPRPMAQMWSSRGCPYQCVFCAWPQIMYGDSTYRVRDPIDIVDEMEYLVKEHGYKSIYFDDDTFGIGKERVLKMCREIKRRKLNIPWAMMTRADAMDKEMLESMADCGLCAIKYGVESGDQELINNSGKNLSLDRVETIVKITKNLGLKLHLTFMLGIMGETEKTVKRTVNFLFKLDPDSAQFSLATPFPGSKYYEILAKKGYLMSSKLSDYDGAKSAVIRTEKLSAENLQKQFEFICKKWNKHLRWRKFKEEGLRYIINKLNCYLRNYFKRK